MSIFSIYLIGFILYSLLCIFVLTRSEFKNESNFDLTIFIIVTSLFWPIMLIYEIIYDLLKLIRRIKFGSV